MALQSTVNKQMSAGVVGEIAFDGPTLVESKITQSTSAANNVFGRAFQQVAGAGNDDKVSADVGSAAAFAGILVNPKEHTSEGLGATIALANDVVAGFAKKGTIIVALGAAANIGDWVFTA